MKYTPAIRTGVGLQGLGHDGSLAHPVARQVVGVGRHLLQGTVLDPGQQAGAIVAVDQILALAAPLLVRHVAQAVIAVLGGGVAHVGAAHEDAAFVVPGVLLAHGVLLEDLAMHAVVGVAHGHAALVGGGYHVAVEVVTGAGFAAGAVNAGDAAAQFVVAEVLRQRLVGADQFDIHAVALGDAGYLDDRDMVDPAALDLAQLVVGVIGDDKAAVLLRDRLDQLGTFAKQVELAARNDVQFVLLICEVALHVIGPACAGAVRHPIDAAPCADLAPRLVVGGAARRIDDRADRVQFQAIAGMPDAASGHPPTAGRDDHQVRGRALVLSDQVAFSLLYEQLKKSRTRHPASGAGVGAAFFQDIDADGAVSKC
ncbi:hypothetical protein [Massilia mucilaginosa]|uniref:hypothetical protein n=1 Tax=Massilia mucilaginosa TaxID=2609282 RepID=UPI001E3A0D74|nr:hypothetical protein [Massilia mucilaginosa]